jgi:nucleoside phosphorylase
MVILVTRTIIYDIHVEIGDPRSEIDHYIVDIEPAPPRDSLPDGVCTGAILTGDRDIIAADVPKLVEEYGALGADWESGAVAYVCKRNNTRCMIVRGVSDLVGPEGGEAYGDGNTLYEESTLHIIQKLDRQLPIWLNLT